TASFVLSSKAWQFLQPEPRTLIQQIPPFSPEQHSFSSAAPAGHPQEHPQSEGCSSFVPTPFSLTISMLQQPPDFFLPNSPDKKPFFSLMLITSKIKLIYEKRQNMPDSSKVIK
ncbi:hypothetical protein, partial [Faecalibaculum rodentium]|uniref:hypothetical protein n=1 Tax=Faecalibaculum rodentium TaxID=1702221 RepID=UPI0026EE4A62